MATYYTYNETTKRLTLEPNYITLVDGRTIVNPMAEQYATFRGAYPKGDDAPMPGPEEGKMVVADGYRLYKRRWQRQWTLVDEPEPAPPPPRTFSKLRIVAALTKAGVWPQVKQYIIDADLYDLYLAAQDFAEDNEYFVQGKTALQTALGWTDEQVEAVLKEAKV